jgi:hypothetical protein
MIVLGSNFSSHPSMDRHCPIWRKGCPIQFDVPTVPTHSVRCGSSGGAEKRAGGPPFLQHVLTGNGRDNIVYGIDTDMRDFMASAILVC